MSFWPLGKQCADGGPGASCVWLPDETGQTRCPRKWGGGEKNVLHIFYSISYCCWRLQPHDTWKHVSNSCTFWGSYIGWHGVSLQVDCLVLQLHRIGEQLEKANSQRMDELFFLLRDGFLLQEGLTSMARLLLLEILEFRAGGWLLSSTAHKYYYSEIAD